MNRVVVTAAVSAATLTVLAGAAAAAGEVTVGQNVVPDASTTCQGPFTVFQTSVSSGSNYRILSAGVITSWQTTASSGSGTRALEIVRPTSSGYTIVANTALTAVATGAPVNQPARITVQPGDIVGLYVGDNTSSCAQSTTNTTDTVAGYAGASPASGTTLPSTPSDSESYALVSVSAVVEPDADGDGYGDTTQDQCPSQAATQGACKDLTAPDTTVTSAKAAKIRASHGRKKHKTGKVTVAFTANEAATFTCSVDGAPDTACNSPLVVKLKKGTHTIAVRASDTAGNADATPATTTVSVKKAHNRHRPR